MTTQAKKSPATASPPIFVPKQDNGTKAVLDKVDSINGNALGPVDLSGKMEALGETLNRIKVLKADLAKVKKAHDALIEEAKTTMRYASIKEYTNEQGIKALAYEFLRTDLDKDMLKDMLGAERYALAEMISVVEAFKVS